MLTTTQTAFIFTFVGLFGKPRSVSLAVLMSLSACGRIELTGQGGTDESTGDTDEPEEALEPACQFAWEWRQRIDDFRQLPDVWAIDVDESGNVYAVGELDLGNLGELDVPVYDSDIWVARWAPDGTQTWVRTFDEPGQIDYGWSLQMGPDGGLFMLGTESGALWLARLDPETGDELWSQVDISGYFLATDLAQTADDQLIVLAGQEHPDRLPWLSQRSPVDGSVAWTRREAVVVGSDKYLFGVEAVAVSNIGDLRVAGTWKYKELQGGGYIPEGGDLLLTYDALGELLDVELTSEGEDSRLSVLIDGSADVYFLSEFDAETGPASMQIESRAADGSLEWIVAESEWSVGGGRRELSLIDLGDGALDIAGSTRDFPDGGWPLWTAKVDPATGALTRGCVHMVEDPDTGKSMRQQIHAGASGPAGGLAIYGEQSSLDPAHPDSDGARWVWMRYLGG